MPTDDDAEPDLTLYGAYTSRPFRVCWMLKELGLGFEHVPVAPGSSDAAKLGAQTPWYRAINPNERIPALRDGGFFIWESAAINLYLVQKYGGPLCPSTPEGFGRALQWAFFMSNDVEPPMVEVRRALFKTAPADRDMSALDKAQTRFDQALTILDEALAGSGYLQGPRWGLADLLAAGVLYALEDYGYEGFERFPRLRGWLDESYARPAAQQAIALYDVS